MSHVLILTNLSAATPDGRPLFSDLSLSVGMERVGLVGRNGSGKSTLLDIVEGRATPVAGTVHRTGSVGRLAQHWPDDQAVAHALGVAHALATLARIEAGLGTAEDFDTADWALPAVVESALDDVGLKSVDLDASMGTLSGGERTRIGIARLLIDRPDLLLLDEPTNNLDRAGRAAIQRLVAGWHGGVLVASHDRVLLEAVDRIVELSPVGIRIVGGGWRDFVAVRDAERAQAEAQRDRADAALRRTRHAAQAAQEAKDRRDKTGRAFAAKGSEPRLSLGARAERSENSGGDARRLAERQISEASAASDTARAQVEVLTPLTIDLLATGLPSQTEVLALQDATVDFGGRRFGPWTFAMRGPERLAIAGPNGAGKSTLLRLAIGDLAPSGGTVRQRRERMAMLDQHVGLLDPADTVIGNMRRFHPTLDEEALHAACAHFAFRNRDAQRIVGSLSGGERLCAWLAAVLSGPQPPWLLLLDEPTNHLDLDSIDVLEGALRLFDGALLVVSHDTRFLDAIGVSQEMGVGVDKDGSLQSR